MQEMWVQFLGQEDPLQKEIAMHSSILSSYFCLFKQFTGFSHLVYQGSLPFPPPVSHILSIYLGWPYIALAHSFIELQNTPVLLFTMCYIASIVSDSVTPWTGAHQAPLSTGFSRQEYWSGLPCPSAGDLPNPGIGPESLMSPALPGGFFAINTI